MLRTNHYGWEANLLARSPAFQRGIDVAERMTFRPSTDSRATWAEANLIGVGPFPTEITLSSSFVVRFHMTQAEGPQEQQEFEHNR